MSSDGKPDLVVVLLAAEFSSRWAVVLKGNGDGTFPAPDAAGVASGSFLTVGDVNGNGPNNLVVASDSGIEILEVADAPQPPMGALVHVGSVNLGSKPDFVAVADLNRDGYGDLAVANGTVSTSLGNGDGTFTAGRTFTAGSGAAGIAIADFNWDGWPDMAVVNKNSNDVSVFLAVGGAGSYLPTTYAVGYSPISIVTGDFSGD